MRHRTIPLLITLLAAAPAVAQQLPHTPAQSQPLGPTGGAISQQPLDAGRVSGSVEIPQPAGEAQVTVRSLEPSSVVGQYRIHFAALDVNGDGFISREEAQANPALADEFNALDVKRRGKLDRADLAGWLAGGLNPPAIFIHAWRGSTGATAVAAPAFGRCQPWLAQHRKRRCPIWADVTWQTCQPRLAPTRAGSRGC